MLYLIARDKKKQINSKKRSNHYRRNKKKHRIKS